MTVDVSTDIVIDQPPETVTRYASDADLVHTLEVGHNGPFPALQTACCATFR